MLILCSVSLLSLQVSYLSKLELVLCDLLFGYKPYLPYFSFIFPFRSESSFSLILSIVKVIFLLFQFYFMNFLYEFVFLSADVIRFVHACVDFCFLIFIFCF